MTIAIIGGGFSGAAVAYHLAQNPANSSADILVFEPRSAIGKGLAYDTPDPAHRINVPAVRMSLLPDDLDHFARWLEANDAIADDPSAIRPDGNVFPRRSVFGEYVHSNLTPFLRNGRIRHVTSAVQAVQKNGQHWRIEDGEGNAIDADIVVIATSHPSPAPPKGLAEILGGHPRFIADPTSHTALDAIHVDDRVLVVGNGLTSADVIASLQDRGHRGKILAVSRRGLRSRGHSPTPQEPYGEFLSPPASSALDLLVGIRTTLRAASEDGITWHAVLDQVRAQASAIWRSLGIAERRRIVRHLRPFWDVHRFRIAPQVEQALDAALAEGRLEIFAGSIGSVRRHGDVIEVDINRKHRPPITREFDAVILTTGPAHGSILSSQPWLKDLERNGHLHVDPTGLGISCNAYSETLRSDLTPDPTLLIAGPLARGRFGELMGLPQVSEHAVGVADRISLAIGK